MKEFGPDELFLNGRLQIETALGALAFTGVNPDAQQQLQKFLDIHADLSDDGSQDDLSLYLKGGTVEQEKADIVNSLDALKDSESTTPEARIASQALRQIL